MLFPYPAACTRKVFVCTRHQSHHAKLVLYLGRVGRANGPDSDRRFQRSLGWWGAEGCVENWAFRVVGLKVCV